MARLELVSPDIDDPILNPIFDKFRDAGHEPPDLYRVLANAPAMLKAWVDLAWPLRLEATTSRALRELIIMRVAVLTDAAFEWEAHWPAALRAGVLEAQLAGLNDWRSSAEFSTAERVALRCVDEVVRDGSASEQAVGDLRGEFSDGECVELLLTASFYCCVSRTLLSFGIAAGTVPTGDGRNEVFALLTRDRDRPIGGR